MLLVFDIGTTIIKSIVFDENGEIKSVGQHEIKLVSPEPGAAEQNPKEWIDAISLATRDALSTGGLKPEDIKGISITSQRGTVVPVKKDGTPLYRALTWMDSRISEFARQHMDEIKQRTILLRLALIKERNSEALANADLIATPISYVIHFLTGKWVTTESDAVYELYSVTEGKRKKLSFSYVDENMFPEIVSPGTVVGSLLDSAARKIWVAPGTPVIMGAGDQQCASVGLGVVSKGQAKMTLGTGLFMDAVVEEPPFEFFDEGTKAFSLPHAIPGLYLVEAVLPGIGSTYRWFRDNIAQDLKTMAREKNTSAYALLDKEAEKVPPGADGLKIIPLMAFGRGSIKNLSFAHTRGHIARAFLESSAMAARFMMDVSFGAYDIYFDSFRGDGGGFRGKIWQQIITDVTGKTLEITATLEHSAALGAAILAGIATGIYKDIYDAISKTVKVVKTLKPGENAEFYESLYEAFQEEFYEEIEKLEI